MSTETPGLRGTTSADLLAIPVVMLGFHPKESCVVLGVRGTRVEFCARMDLDWFTSGFSFGEVADQLEHAIERCGGCSVAVLAYSKDVEAAAVAVGELVSVLGEEDVAEVLVTDGDRFWYANPGMLFPPEGISYSWASSNFAAQAVYSGVNVTATRADAVAAVQPPQPHLHAEIDDRLALVIKGVSAMTVKQKWAHLERLLENEEPLGPSGAAQFVVVLQDEECFAEVLARMNMGSASRLRAKLMEARQSCTPSLAGNVVSLLALACWLDGEGAQQSDCLSQLETIDPGHPLMGVLRRMHRQAVPPRGWDA